jgi:RimJ/RimL family protein N-acetyltransferase
VVLTWSFASRDGDGDEFAAFSCWDGSSDTPWVEEVENYVRHWVFRDAQHVLALRNENGDLVAVAAFAQRTIAVPLLAPVDHPGWHLIVVAIRLEDQRHGLSAEVFSAVFEAMRTVDPDRVLYTATAHRENVGSMRACERIDLLPFVLKDDHYWVLLGEVRE